VGFPIAENENPADWLMDVLSGEVKNTRLPDFRLETLFEHWVNNGSEWKENGEAHSRPSTRARARLWTATDDEVIIRQALHEEWRKFNCNELTLSELGLVLQGCAGTIPSKGVVEELFLRMGGTEGGHVTERQFQDFLLGLRGSVASDATANAEGPAVTTINSRVMGSLSKTFSMSRSATGNLSAQVTATPTAALRQPRDPREPAPKRADSSQSVQHDETGRALSSRAVNGFGSGVAPGAAPSPSPQTLSSRASFGSTSSGSESDDSDDEFARRQKTQHPGCLAQYWILLHRCLLSWLRQNRQRMIAVLLIVFSAFVFGRISAGKVSVNSPALCPTLTGTHLALAVPLGISCLHVFGSDRPVFWRENARGVSVFAFWLSRVTVAIFDVFVLAIVYASTWFLVVNPEASFHNFWGAFVLLSFNAMAWGFLISTIIPPHSSTLALAVALLAMCGGLSDSVSLANKPTETTIDSAKVSAFSWTVGMTLMEMVDENHGKMGMFQEHFVSSYEKVMDTPFGYYWGSVFVLSVMTTIVMFLSYVGLVFSGRSHQV